MAISLFRNWIERHRPGWLAAILFVSTLAVGACAATPAMATATTVAGPAGHCPMLQHNTSGACCLKSGVATHAIAIPANDFTPHLSMPPAGHAAYAAATFSAPTVQTARSLRPPIRAPAASSRSLFLLNCALLN